MAPEWIAATIDCLAYASLTLAIATLSRTLRLHNLAAGAIAIIGSWVVEELLGQGSHHTNPVWLLPIGALIALLCALPLFIPSTLRNRPLVFLILSVGCSLCICALAQGRYLASSSSSLPQPSVTTAVVSGVLAVAISAAFATIPMISPAVSRFVLRWRIAGAQERSVWRFAVCALVTQSTVLIAVGYLTSSAHKGMIATAEFRTVISLIAIFLVRGHALMSACLASVGALAIHVLEINTLSSYPDSMVLGAFALVAIVQGWPRDGLNSSHPAAPVLPRTDLRGVYLRTTLVGGTVVFLGIALWLNGTLSSNLGHTVAFGAIMVMLTWTVLRVLGVLTLFVPTLAGLAGFGLALHNGTGIVELATVIAVAGVVGSLYLMVLRRLPVAAAIVTDLSLVLAGHRVVKRVAELSGANEVVNVALPASLTALAPVAAAMLLLSCPLIAALVYGSQLPLRWRARTLGLASMLRGRAHGTNPIRTFLVAGALVSSAIAIAEILFRAGAASLSPEELSIHHGLLALGCAYLAAFSGPAVAIIAYSGIALIGGVAGLGHGVTEQLLTGIALGVSVVLAARREAQQEGAST